LFAAATEIAATVVVGRNDSVVSFVVAGRGASVVGGAGLAKDEYGAHTPHILGQFFCTTSAPHSRASKTPPHSACSDNSSQIGSVRGVTVVAMLVVVVTVVLVVEGVHALHMTGQ